MKKIILLSILTMMNVSASEYLLTLENKHFENKISIKPITEEGSNPTPNPEPTTCILPEVLDEAGENCINNIEKVGWINTGSDSCNGMRQSNFNPNVFFARSNSRTVDLNLEIPEGFHWVSVNEYATLFNDSSVPNKNDSISVYATQCGLVDYPKADGGNQSVFLFSDNGSTGMHAGNFEIHGMSLPVYSATNTFAGYVLYKEY